MRTFILRERRHLETLLAFIAANWEAMAKDKPMQVTCEPESKRRSTRQNRYYWSVINQIAEHAWIEGRQYSPDAWHELVKRRFNGTVDLPGGGKLGITTTDMSTAEFADYTSRIEAWAATELGVTFETLEPMGRCA